jgi:hypothetical protein
MSVRLPVGFHATSPQAIERAAQLWSDRQDNFDRDAARAEGLRHALSDADSAAVLDALVESGELDEERIEDLLMQAAERRINAALPTPRTERLRRLLASVKTLIDACDDSLDRSTLLQGAKADAFTVWVQCGGAL